MSETTDRIAARKRDGIAGFMLAPLKGPTPGTCKIKAEPIAFVPDDDQERP